MEILDIDKNQQFKIDDVVMLKHKDEIIECSIIEIHYIKEKYSYRVENNDFEEYVDATRLLALNKATVSENYWIQEAIAKELGYIVNSGYDSHYSHSAIQKVIGFIVYSKNKIYEAGHGHLLSGSIRLLFNQPYEANNSNYTVLKNYIFLTNEINQGAIKIAFDSIISLPKFFRNFTKAIKSNRKARVLDIKKLEEFNILDIDKNLLNLNLLKDDIYNIKANLEKSIMEKEKTNTSILEQMISYGKMRRTSRKFFNIINKNMNYNIDRKIYMGGYPYLNHDD